MDQDSPRELVDHLEREFTRLIENLKQLVNSVTSDLLYRRPPSVTIGDNLLRSAAVLEQTFGGLTANLWDDPFEWTLPETLSSAELIDEYLSEVDDARERAFRSITGDRELTKYISGPSGEPQQLFVVLVDTLVKASDYHGRAVATLKMLFGEGGQKSII
ncbi:MAG TPA: hypothetical protein VM941_05620 [Pyrinomonadaceae bacterium]|jgi:hypothetical protein|nr:hypothetical protein [Pyrinomonadaceae bacterium]